MLLCNRKSQMLDFKGIVHSVCITSWNIVEADVGKHLYLFCCCHIVLHLPGSKCVVCVTFQLSLHVKTNIYTLAWYKPCVGL